MEEVLQKEELPVCGQQQALVKAGKVCYPWAGFSGPVVLEEKVSGVG